MKKPIINRIYEKIICDIKTRCWNWTGCLNNYGYGRISINSKMQLVHRIIYQKFYGLIPVDKPCVLHKCDNPKCCNPKHLYTGTQQNNANDREKRNRSNFAHGEKHYRAKLTEKQVLEIRVSKETQTVLAKQLKVHRCTIDRIQNRKTWKHL